MPCLYVICYDIADPRRLARVARVMEGFGERVQESVFECWLTPGRLHQLQQRVGSEIRLGEDTVRYYPLCGKDRPDVQVIGAGCGVAVNRGWVAV